ncbi:universal stress protein [Mucilaginibacter sp.]|uniref:universal stress protein n=1 Tax=Mucilaginibacter sp. TaxID=1882438 RepID=UPI002BAF7B5D|nr:universal stress protein [Mucilaginibacter sp.]HTI58729.1 universal stress protein [Mucilaginibacter sp.]
MMMKNILVLTDFSENAASAAEAGLQLAGKLHTDLLLFNTYIDYKTITSYAGGGWAADGFSERQQRSKIGLQTLTEGLESLSYQLSPEDHKPAINTESDDSDLGLDVADIIRQKDVEMVVMGARAGTESDLMFGADTNAVIEYSTRPVLVTPSGTKLNDIHKIVFATNFEKADLEAIRFLSKLGNLFHYKLEIIHVSDPEKNGADDEEAEFAVGLAKIKYTGLQYHKINGKDVINRLNRFVTEIPGTMLAMVHVQNSFLVRLFRHSTVKKALTDQKIPLLVFPSKMK